MPKPKDDVTESVFATEPTHNNRGLFAPHYIKPDGRVTTLSDWQQDTDAPDVMAAIAELYKKTASRFGPNTKEAQTENKFIQPVLKLLGWEWESQEPIAGCRRTPDYALLFTHDDWDAIQKKKGTTDYWASVPVLADAKAWTASLDQKRDGETPTDQITNYLYRANVRWGILTNGRQWRLYEREKSHPGGIYYEVDLVELLEHGSPKNFRYFYLFFRRDAFAPVDGASFVERVFQGTIDYATEVGDGLKESVYDALRRLMNGFLDHTPNALDRGDQDTLRDVHDHCLILLYRLLFVLYAEDGGLLPLEEPAYTSYSLRTLQQRINKHLRGGPDLLPAAVTLWHELLNLFRLIDAGYSKAGRTIIPAYNGGLFADERFPAIAHSPHPGAPRWDIGDSHLAEAIDMLAYKRDTWNEPGEKDVDYDTLDVQDLGAIYEGLLELKPAVADQDLIEQPGKSGKPPVVVPQADVPTPKKVRGQPPREFRADEVYLVTDRGERKATGSYYTPKYIVDYIVENTVLPLCDQAAEQTRQIAQQIETLEKRRRRLRNPDSIRAADAELDDLHARRLDPYLSLKILDPAIGSGHFLVGAADTVSLAMATDPNLPDVPDQEPHHVRGYYKRLVARHCLYGVDLNWLAVELAKLSLWLHTVQRDQALDFLDHHLRCGNSLIGARIEDDLSKQPSRIDAKGKVTAPDDN
ncbi:MAG: N-6 DNA methylase, partial [Armatimonadota bacterium]